MSREISVYDGQDRIGRLLVRRPGKDGLQRVESYNTEGVSLGIYPDVKAGFVAVSAAARPRTNRPRRKAKTIPDETAVDLKAPGTPKSKGVGGPAA